MHEESKLCGLELYHKQHYGQFLRHCSHRFAEEIKIMLATSLFHVQH
jgi:hypothetical protein